jgi:N-acetylmuramoyl-L-alanine amidase
VKKESEERKNSKMKKLAYLVIHCTATPKGRVVTKEEIIRWHTAPKEKGGRGWKQVGYSDMILLDGTLVNLVPHNENDVVDPWEITNGASGINSVSRHIVYVGGMDEKYKKPEDTRTDSQKKTMEDYVKQMIKSHPKIKVMGHYQAPDAGGKACPSFDVPKWLLSIGIQVGNIYKL